jgi:hypothetical protein
MRLACGLAIALCLTIPAAGVARQQQDPKDPPNPAAPAPGPPQRAAEKPASGTSTAPDKGAPGDAVGSSPDASTHAADVPSTHKPATNSAGRSPKRHKRPGPPPADGPKKVVVRQGGASEPAAQISPGLTPAEAVRERQNVERLLGAADDQLQMLSGRPLDEKRQETVVQVRNYLVQARSALKEGDLRRANTLAQKAHLLSDDLVKR